MELLTREKDAAQTALEAEQSRSVEMSRSMEALRERVTKQRCLVVDTPSLFILVYDLVVVLVLAPIFCALFLPFLN